VPADDSTVAFMCLKRAVDVIDEILPDRVRVEQILPNVAKRKRRLFAGSIPEIYDLAN